MRIGWSAVLLSATLAACSGDPAGGRDNDMAAVNDTDDVAVGRTQATPDAAETATSDPAPRAAPSPQPRGGVTPEAAARSDRKTTTAAPGDARYNCIDGSSLSVHFEGDRATVSRDGAAPATLDARATGSGFDYRSGNYVLRGKAGQVTFSAPDQPPLACAESQ